MFHEMVLMVGILGCCLPPNFGLCYIKVVRKYCLLTLFLMKPKLDLVSMLLVNINGRSSVPNIKKIKANEGFTGMRPAEDTIRINALKSYCIMLCMMLRMTLCMT